MYAAKTLCMIVMIGSVKIAFQLVTSKHQKGLFFICSVPCASSH